MMHIGQSLPEMELEALIDGQITSVNLAETEDQWTVLITYPADFTFICPTELSEVAKHEATFEELGARVMSVSTDTVWSHKAWQDTSEAIGQVSFPMLADPTGKLCRALGTYLEDEGVSLRATFLFDPEGQLRAFEMHDNSIGRAIGETLRKLQAAIHVRDAAGEVCPASWTPGEQTLTPSAELVGKL